MQRKVIKGLRTNTKRIELLWLKQIGVTGENWIHLAKNRNKWRAFVNTVMNRRVPNIREIIEQLASENSSAQWSNLDNVAVGASR